MIASWRRVRLSLPVGTTAVNTRIYGLPVANLMIMPLAPLTSWIYVTHGEPTALNNTIYVSFINANSSTVVVNVLFWYPSTFAGSGGPTPSNYTIPLPPGYINVMNLGAFGDGGEHPLSDIYPTLSAAQAVYPFATSLTEETDFCAIQKALNQCAPAGGTVYLPVGTYIVDPQSNTRWLDIVASNTSIVGMGPGSKIKIKDDCGDYFSVFYQNLATHLTDILFNNLTVDANPDGNTTQNVAAGAAAALAIAIYNFDDVIVSDCVFDKCIGINTVALNGPACSGATIEDCTFVFQHNSVALYDNSAVYLDCANQLVTNNTFSSDDQQFAVSAIECHTGPSIDITYNHIDGYNNGMNITSQLAGVQITNDVTVAHNTITDCNGGITLWGGTGYALKGVVVEQNTVTANNADRWNAGQTHMDDSTCWGVVLVLTIDPLLQGNFEDITIRNNSFVFQPQSRDIAWGQSGSAGILVNCVGTVANLEVSNNTVANHPSQGMRLSPVGAFTDSNILSNSFTDCGNDAGTASNPGYRLGILTFGPFNNVNISNNTIHDTHTPTSGLNGYILFPAAVGCTFFHNVVTSVALPNLVNTVVFGSGWVVT